MVADSFAIALHLEAAYPDAPSLFSWRGRGRRSRRFVAAWADTGPERGARADGGRRHLRGARAGGPGLLPREPGGPLRRAARDRAGRPGEPGRRVPARASRRSPRLEGAALISRASEPAYADYIVFGGYPVGARHPAPSIRFAPDDPVHAWRERLGSTGSTGWRGARRGPLRRGRGRARLQQGVKSIQGSDTSLRERGRKHPAPHEGVSRFDIRARRWSTPRRVGLRRPCERDRLRRTGARRHAPLRPPSPAASSTAPRITRPPPGRSATLLRGRNVVDQNGLEARARAQGRFGALPPMVEGAGAAPQGPSASPAASPCERSENRSPTRSAVAVGAGAGRRGGGKDRAVGRRRGALRSAGLRGRRERRSWRCSARSCSASSLLFGTGKRADGAYERGFLALGHDPWPLCATLRSSLVDSTRLTYVREEARVYTSRLIS